MTDWQAHLTEAEADRLRELDEQAKASSKERRLIFDRARKRALRAGEVASIREVGDD